VDRAAFSFRFGSAEFDESRFELRVAGLPVEVERRALEVLAYLLRHAGEAVTKEELLRDVWSGRVTVDKVLPNAITKLRRALGEANAEHLSTLARVGYRLDGPISRVAVGRQLLSELQLAIGQSVPSRPNFVLREQLARTAGNEVWLAEHGKTREQRVYKFGLDSGRLRALKREATLLRVLQESLADCSHFVDIIDWNFENPPYFLECGYGGDNLGEWAKTQLDHLDDAARVGLFLQIADAVAAAHSVGVLHKDLKPANVLISARDGQLQVRLTDFGSGHLLDIDQLEKLGITRLGMTLNEGVGDENGSWTPLYLAPEVFEGHTPTAQSDVYALGILLYQVLSGQIGRPMASGWEQAIADPLLQDDIRQATNGDPARRLSSAAELAARLRSIEVRRQRAADQAEREASAERLHATLARAKARRPFVLALISVLIVSVGIALWHRQVAVRASNEARIELERASAITRFVTEDLIGSSNPLVSAKGAEANLKEVLLAARTRIGQHFSGHASAEASVRLSLATLFNTIDLFPEAEQEARQALALIDSDSRSTKRESLQARSLLVSVLSKLGKHDEAATELIPLSAIATQYPSAESRYLVASAKGSYLITSGDYAGAAGELTAAVDALGKIQPINQVLLDSLRLNLITCLALSGADADAKAIADSLIAEASKRHDDGELTVALAKMAVVRAYGEDHASVGRLLAEAQPIIVERLGDNHSRHLQLLGELLGLSLRQGKLEDGIQYAEKLHARVRAKNGDAHPLTYVTLSNWGLLLYEAGQLEQAAPPLREACKRLAAITGINSPRTQICQQSLASVELELGNSTAAGALIDGLDAQTLETSRTTGLWQATIDAMRGIALQQAGDAAAARALLAPALDQLASEEDLDAPGRLYVLAHEALTKLQ